MIELNNLLRDWKEINVSFLKLKKEKKKIETSVLKLLRENNWNDYRNGGVHVSILTKVNEYVDLVELPLLLSKSDIEKITHRNTVKKLLIVSTDMRKEYNKKLVGGK